MSSSDEIDDEDAELVPSGRRFGPDQKTQQHSSRSTDYVALGGPELNRRVCGIRVIGRTIQQWQLDGRSAGQMGADERKAIWHEVFFNLSYATAVAGISGYLIRISDWTGPINNGLHVLAFASLYLPLYYHWISHGLYLNRFDNSDTWHNLYQLLNVAMMCLAAANVPSCTRAWLFEADAPDNYGACSDYSYLMFALRLSTVCMYVRAAIYIPQKTLFCIRKCVELCSFALAWLFNGIFQRYLYGQATFIFTWWGVVLADMIIPLITPRIFPQKVGFVAVNIDLLIERFGLFFVTALGNSVVAATLIPESSFDKIKFESYAISIMVVCFAFCFKLTYHDCNRATNDDIDLHAMRWRHWTGILWIMMHMPLTAGIIVMSSFFMQALATNDLTSRQRWYMCASISLVLLSLTALQLLHKKSKSKVRVGPFIRIQVRLIAAVLICILPLIPGLPLWALFLTILALLLSYTLLDMFGNRALVDPYSIHPDEPGAIDLADIFSTDGVHKNIHGMVVGGQLKGYDNLRMRGRDVSSAYI